MFLKCMKKMEMILLGWTKSTPPILLLKIILGSRKERSLETAKRQMNKCWGLWSSRPTSATWPKNKFKKLFLQMKPAPLSLKIWKVRSRQSNAPPATPKETLPTSAAAALKNRRWVRWRRAVRVRITLKNSFRSAAALATARSVKLRILRRASKTPTKECQNWERNRKIRLWIWLLTPTPKPAMKKRRKVRTYSTTVSTVQTN